jgi:hypothetical protein
MRARRIRLYAPCFAAVQHAFDSFVTRITSAFPLVAASGQYTGNHASHTLVPHTG